MTSLEVMTLAVLASGCPRSTLLPDAGAVGCYFWLGLGLVAAGFAVLGYVGWQMFGTNVVSRHKAAEIRTQTRTAWAEGHRGPAGAILHVPRFGKKYAVPIIKGFDEDTLAKGIAWYPKGAGPGKVGNYVLAGHRITHGQPFSKFPTLRKGDLVMVETRAATYTYRLRNSGTSITVDFRASWPLWSIPAEPGETSAVGMVKTPEAHESRDHPAHV